MENRIKFRAFNPKYGKIYPVIILGDETCYLPYDYEEESKNCLLIVQHPQYVEYKLNNLKLMQCTGLKDKNGKLIFEGDIVNYSFQYTNGKASNVRIGKVIYQENTGVFAIWGDKEPYGQTKRILFEKLITQNIEIIGNIYQDSHLLDNANNNEL